MPISITKDILISIKDIHLLAAYGAMLDKGIGNTEHVPSDDVAGFMDCNSMVY
jgi:hypothetical protein